MTITLRPGSTVLFAGDSITDLWRPEGEDRAGYPLRIAGEWCFRHPGRPVTWVNAGHAGDGVRDLEARWAADVLSVRPDLVSLLVGVNDMRWHAGGPRREVLSVDEFASCYDRLLAPLAGVDLLLIEPFLVPISGDIEAVMRPEGAEVVVRISEADRAEWRADLDPKIQVVRELADAHGAHLLAADGLFASLSASGAAERWSADGIHPTPAGHGVLADAWLELVD